MFLGIEITDWLVDVESDERQIIEPKTYNYHLTVADNSCHKSSANYRVRRKVHLLLLIGPSQRMRHVVVAPI